MFSAPAFLLGLLAIGIPLWVHRLARDYQIRRPFASLMLLEQSKTQHTTKRTLRYLPLLALRIALLVLLALAFAEPLLSSKKLAAVTPTARLQAIVMDTSASMQYEGRWQAALAEAERIVSGLNAGDRVMLIDANGRRVQIAQSAIPAREAGQVRSALKTLTPGNSRLDYGALFATADSWLGTPRPPTDVHLITDAQQTGMPLHFADLALPRDARLVMHVVGQAASNAYVKGARLTDLNARKLNAEVANDGEQAAARDVELEVDGRSIAQTHVEIPAHQTANAEFVLGAIEAPRAQRVVVRLKPADALAVDDSFRTVIDNAIPRILLIALNPSDDEAQYFATALESTGSSRIAVERTAVNGVDVRTLSQYAALMIADTGALSTELATAVERYLKGGGRVFASVGTHAVTRKIEPLTQLAVRDQRGSAQIASLDSTHPALRESSGWSQVRFLRTIAVTPREQDRVLIRLNDGNPLLIERNVGGGELMLLCAPLDRDWNDLAIHPVFVRFAGDIGRLLTHADESIASSIVGAPVATGLTPEAGGQIFDPQGERALGLNELEGASRFTPEMPGFYEIRRSTGSRWLAVNTDSRESELASISAATAKQWAALPNKNGPPKNSAVDATADVGGDSTDKRSIGLALLLVAAALLMLEFLFANHHLFVRRETPV